MRIKFPLLAVGLLGIASISRADSLSPQLHDVAIYLASNSILPITQQADMQLARNLLTAQGAIACTYCGAESLQMSEDSVLRAISLYCCWDGSPVLISSESLPPGPLLQSRIAIDPGATVVVTPSALYFGEVPVATPEPEVWILMLIGATAFTLRKRGFAWLSEFTVP